MFLLRKRGPVSRCPFSVDDRAPQVKPSTACIYMVLDARAALVAIAEVIRHPLDADGATGSAEYLNLYSRM